MSRRRLVSLLAAVSLAAAGASAIAAPPAPSTAKLERTLHGAGSFHAFVQFDRPVRDSDVAALAKLGITKMHAFKYVNSIAVIAPVAKLAKAANLPGVTAVVRDNGLKLDLDKSKKALKVDKARAAKPKGNGLTGKGVTVAVIDSGLDDTHPDFAGRVKENLNFEGGWMWDAWQDGSITNEVAETTGPYGGVDEIGHGTHVASTVGGSGAAGKGPTGTGADYSGVAPGVEFVGMKVASAAQGVAYDMGWEANAMAAIEYLMEHNKTLKVSIVQNSWSVFEVTHPDSEPVIQMIRAAVNSGLIFVFSAGNNGGDGANSVSWPGAMGNVITVGSTLKTAPYKRSDFSAQGQQVDLMAPGSNIVAARSKGAVIDLQNAATPAQDRPYYMAISGTSMSSPHISGVIALMKQANPRLTGEAAEEILSRTASDLGGKGKDTLYGWGFVDAYKATTVAACLAKSSSAKREGCFSSVKALAKSKYRSDWKSKGNETPTSNADEPLPPV